MAALPGSMREEAAVMRERIHVDPAGWWEVGEDVSCLPLVQDAVMRERKLTFDYIRADGEVGPRTVDPMGLVAKGSTWYFVARTPKGMRTFRLSRMSAVTVLATGFKRPKRFDLAAHWIQSTTELAGRRGGYPALLAVKEGTVKRLTGWLAAKLAEGAGAAGLDEGWVAIEMSFEHLEQARFMVLGLGARARVLEPPELQRAVAEEIGRMVAQASQAPSVNRP